jgi:hypothetical protein
VQLVDLICLLDSIANRVCVEHVETAQCVEPSGLWLWLSRFLVGKEGLNEPVPGPLQRLPVILVEVNDVADGEGGSVVGESGSGDDEQVEEET